MYTNTSQQNIPYNIVNLFFGNQYTDAIFPFHQYTDAIFPFHHNTTCNQGILNRLAFVIVLKYTGRGQIRLAWDDVIIELTTYWILNGRCYIIDFKMYVLFQSTYYLIALSITKYVLKCRVTEVKSHLLTFISLPHIDSPFTKLWITICAYSFVWQGDNIVFVNLIVHTKQNPYVLLTEQINK